MDYFREMLNMGGNIMDQVNEAIERNDYSGLAKGIKEEVSQFTKTAAGQNNVTYTRTTRNSDGSQTTFTYSPVDIDLGTRNTGKGKETSDREKTKKEGSGFWGGNYSNYRTGDGKQTSNWNYSKGQAATSNSNPTNPTTTAITPFNKFRKRNAWSRGFGKQMIGAAGVAVTVPAAISFAAMTAVTGPAALIGAAIFGAGTGVSAFFINKGGKERKLSNTFDKYSKIIGDAEYTSIEDLSEKSMETPEAVQENLDKMISAGMLPQAKFDTGKTTMMLTKNAYDQYLLAENARKSREEEEAELDAKAGSPAARKVIEEGENFVIKLKAANDAIPGRAMSEKLDQMERIVSKIFAQVKKEPSSAEDLRKFMNYYLPTTEKLLNAYIDLDKQPEVGENITKTKQEIEETVDTINNAFENLLDSLFQDIRWDISSDISVMKTMMEQDGLMDRKEFDEDHSPQ